jgi:DNA primase
VISQESIERVKTESNIVELVSETVKLRRAGMYYSGLCPFHSERSPSFFVRESSNSYTCYGCGASGNVISFVMGTRAMNFPDAVEFLAGRFGIELKYDSKRSAGPTVDREKLFSVCQTAHNFFRHSLMQVKKGQGEFAKVGEYLKKRGLTAEAINAFGIGYSPNQRGVLIDALKAAGFDDDTIMKTGLVRRTASGELYEMFRSRLVFPIYVDSKRIAGFGGRIVPGVLDPAYEQQAPKYLNSPETPIYHKSKTIYGLPQAMTAIREAGEVFVVEGYMDVVGLWMKGVRNVVACCGTAMTEQHVKRFASVCNRVHLLFDGDSAGRNAAAKGFMVARNAEIDVTACFLPDDVDPDDFARQHGDAAGHALHELPKAELLDVYIDGLLAKMGCASGEKPGPNLLGKLCDEVAKAIAGVDREVVRSSFLTRAARRLGVEVPQIGRLVDQIRVKGSTRTTEEERPSVSSGNKGASVKSSDEEAPSARHDRQPAKLPRIDLDILRSVMVLKAEVLPGLIANAEVCGLIQPETLRFIMAFKEILDRNSEDEAYQRQAVKEYLQSLGSGWVALWKEAYKMAKADVSMQELYRVSLLGLRREKLRVLMEECKQELLTGGDDPHRQLEISERIRSLKSQLDAYGRGVDLTPPNS